MRPSAARTSSSPPNIVPLLTDDDSDDENKRLDRELHKDLVNSLRDTVSAFIGEFQLYSDVMRVLVARKRFAFLCLLRFLSRAGSKLTDDVFLYRYVLGSVRLCERVRHLAPVLLSQQQQQQRRRKRTRRSGCIVTFERDGGRGQSEQPSASISQTWW